MKLHSRKQKINLLRAIQQGRATVASLQPPEIYIFYERNNKPGFYEMNGKEYNETEYLQFCERIKNKNRNSIVWHEGKEYTGNAKIITFRVSKGCEPIYPS